MTAFKPALAVLIFSSVVALSASSAGLSDSPAEGAVPEWAGRYQGMFDAYGSMTVEPSSGGTFRVTWEGGADDGAGAATAADCSAVARATPKDKTHLRADLVPFGDKNGGGLTEEDLKALEVLPLDIAWIGNGVVRVTGSFPHCGLNVALAGLYWHSPPASAVRELSKEYESCSRSAADIALCAKQESQRQDERLNRDYKVLTAKLSQPHRAVVRQAQRQWITQRDKLCAASSARVDASCIARATAERADALEVLMKAASQPASGTNP